MNMLSPRAACAALAMLALILVTSAAPTAATSTAVPATGGELARELPVSADDFGEMQACMIDSTGTTCYRSEAEMDQAEAAAQSANNATGLAADCSTSVRLYRQTSYGGQVLGIRRRGAFLSLGSFNNDTSSYKIGACSARFYDGGAGSTSYPATPASAPRPPRC